MMRRAFGFLWLLLAMLASPGIAHAENGYDLWLRYEKAEPLWRAQVDPALQTLVWTGGGATLKAAAGELQRGVTGIMGHALADAPEVDRDGAVLIGTPESSPFIAALDLPLAKLGREGFLIRSMRVGGHHATVIAANGEVGVLYGVFRLLREMQERGQIGALDISDRPRLDIRMLDHWDNLTRHVERGYAGLSLWDWPKLPQYSDPRYTDYARANASIGINGTVLNNVNANALILTPEWLAKVKTIADALRPWGMKVYLTARFSAPIEIGGLKTADPLDPAVAAFWKAKADEIYSYIPDFGGFLVKANSEGQPGPQDYHRSHADGANMLADALAPHHGVVIWRAFVYSAENSEDRAKQAYSEFVPLDGQFRDNVLLQVKNGAIDFQPREPFHPMFGAMPKTPLMMEFQITKEYLGFATHLAYLGTMWEEALEADTFRPKQGTTVANVIETPVDGHALTGMAGVSNIGNDIDWTGSIFNQANWYAFGRLAWDPQAHAEDIARDWARLTWGNDRAVTDPIVAMMMESREAVVDYMTPLGLAHQMATGHHYGPGPWVSDLKRPEWNPVYYARADAGGIGFDRTKSGSDAVSQYAPEVAKLFADPKKVPEKFLLWFHHLPWDTKIRSSGRTLWDELVVDYDRGIDTVREMARTWDGMKGKVDAERFAQVKAYLAIQLEEALWWRNASVAWFQSISKRPLPAGHAEPPHDLQYYEAIQTPYAPGSAQ